MQSAYDRDNGDDVPAQGPRDADGRRRWTEERAAEMDTLLPGRDEHLVLG